MLQKVARILLILAVALCVAVVVLPGSFLLFSDVDSVTRKTFLDLIPACGLAVLLLSVSVIVIGIIRKGKTSIDSKVGICTLVLGLLMILVGIAMITD